MMCDCREWHDGAMSPKCFMFRLSRFTTRKNDGFERVDCGEVSVSEENKAQNSAEER